MDRVVFIGGCDRSGTTMLGELIGRSDKAVPTPESQFKTEVLHGRKDLENLTPKDLEAVFNQIREHWRFKIWDLPDDIILPNYRSYQELLFSIVDAYNKVKYKPQKSEAVVWVDHTPNNIDQFIFLGSQFEDFKFIHIIRDGRGVFSSFKGLDWGPRTALFAARYWVNRLSFGFAMEKYFGEHVLRVRYEDILLSPEDELRKIFKFIDIELPTNILNKSCKEFIPDYTKLQHALVGENIDTYRINRWKNVLTKKEIEIFEFEAAPLLHLLGYDLENADPFYSNLSAGEKGIIWCQEILLRIKNKLYQSQRLRKAVNR